MCSCAAWTSDSFENLAGRGKPTLIEAVSLEQSQSNFAGVLTGRPDSWLQPVSWASTPGSCSLMGRGRILLTSAMLSSWRCTRDVENPSDFAPECRWMETTRCLFSQRELSSQARTGTRVSGEQRAGKRHTWLVDQVGQAGHAHQQAAKHSTLQPQNSFPPFCGLFSSVPWGLCPRM